MSGRSVSLRDPLTAVPSPTGEAETRITPPRYTIVLALILRLSKINTLNSIRNEAYILAVSRV